LSSTRRKGWSDEEIIRRYPTVLALSPPRIRAAPELPEAVASVSPVPPETNELAMLREALRLRVRWTQELQARAAWELGERLTRRGLLAAPDQIRHRSTEDLPAMVRGEAPDRDVEPDPPRDTPLPAAFRLADNGVPLPVTATDGDGPREPAAERAADRPIWARTTNPRPAPSWS
jgi:hypothetical protein